MWILIWTWRLRCARSGGGLESLGVVGGAPALMGTESLVDDRSRIGPSEDQRTNRSTA
jgi:hypothetical protein